MTAIGKMTEQFWTFYLLTVGLMRKAFTQVGDNDYHDVQIEPNEGSKWIILLTYFLDWNPEIETLFSLTLGLALKT